MKSKEEQIQELQDIKNLMERSSRFLSISGLAGIFAGTFALIGAFIAYFIILDNGKIKFDEHFQFLNTETIGEIQISLILLALIILILASISAYYFSLRKAKKLGQEFWNKTTIKVLYNFSLPLLAGGIFTILLILHNNIHLVASATLIFYGLALINASKFTVSEIHFLGLSEIGLGLLAGIFLNYGIIFWAIGFGILHIIYGAVMFYKYE